MVFECVRDDGVKIRIKVSKVDSMKRLGDQHTVIRYVEKHRLIDAVFAEPYNQVLRKYVEAMNGKNS